MKIVMWLKHTFYLSSLSYF